MVEEVLHNKFDYVNILKKFLENHYLPNLTKMKYVTWTTKTIKNNLKTSPQKRNFQAKTLPMKNFTKH